MRPILGSARITAAGCRVFAALAKAYLGRKSEALRDAEAALALAPYTEQTVSNTYFRRVISRAYVVMGEQEKALDLIEDARQLLRGLSVGLHSPRSEPAPELIDDPDVGAARSRVELRDVGHHQRRHEVPKRRMISGSFA